ncbi:MAG: GNAT family N-acetyltransferase [Solirubrobacteraceae bacterium]
MLDLRPITPDDAAAVHDLLGDPAVATWLRRAGDEGPFTLADCETMVARAVAHWTAHGFGRSLAWENGRCIGWSLVQHTIAAGRGEVEVGWTVARDHWGQGVATELGRRALSEASDLQLRRVVAFTRRDNAASRRVMEKLGLEYAHEFEHAGWPHVLYRAPPPQPKPDFLTRG